MKLAIDILEERISTAMAAATGCDDCAAIVRPSTDPRFGDYQANGVMALAKKLKTNPCKLAEDVVGNLDLSDICEPPEVAGPGFINLRLKPDFLADRLLEINRHIVSLGIDKAAVPKTIVVDFSSPNIAKQMHVGHLRSTIIGDCICRVLEFLGHKVIRQNHVGDWGTQFGMLCARLNEKVLEASEGEGLLNVSRTLEDLEQFYKEAKLRYDTNEEFRATAHDAVRGLHNGETFWINEWKDIVRESRKHYLPIYRMLKVDLTEKDERGESEYNSDLPDIVDELKKQGLAKESDSAICVFPPGFKNKEGQPLPFIIQKSDGAYLYATTDLAALRYRVNELKANAIIYVTDARQKLHFEMLFAVAKMAKWVSDNIELSHVMFGSILGDDGTPLKTRAGENVKLKELLDEAVERAKKIVEEKNPELSPDKKEQIAKAVGIGAVKYADYSNNRTSDYVFSFDKMLAMDGNTAPYMQYAYARIKSIERKAQTKKVDIEDELKEIEALDLTDPAELDLAKYLIRYGESIQTAAADYRPNYLTAYLYELAQKFSAFYTNCPVLKAKPDKRPTRLLLCDLTAKTIKHGLSELLGIEVVEQM
ncbi:MAG TPA: arginine--tRNA ligase [Sedimentisphaerales bacterium]|nr:arginine--tRNA ligase [Sedimentisphaerales bacterium]